MNINTFRQIIRLVPDCYSHEWVNAQLVVEAIGDISSDLKLLQRNNRVKLQLETIAMQHFSQWCSLAAVDAKAYLANKVWH